MEELIGIGAAFGFAIFNALAAVLVNTRLRAESPLSMTFLAMLVAMILSAAALFIGGHYEWLFQAHEWYQWACTWGRERSEPTPPPKTHPPTHPPTHSLTHSLAPPGG